MRENDPLQIRVNALSSEVLFAQPSVGKLRERLQALHGDVDARELRSAFRALENLESALTTIEQVASRFGTER